MTKRGSAEIDTTEAPESIYIRSLRLVGEFAEAQWPDKTCLSTSLPYTTTATHICPRQAAAQVMCSRPHLVGIWSATPESFTGFLLHICVAVLFRSQITRQTVSAPLTVSGQANASVFCAKLQAACLRCCLNLFGNDIPVAPFFEIEAI